MIRRIEVGSASIDLSSDGSVKLEPPCRIVVRAEDSQVGVLEVGDFCDGGEIEVVEGDEFVCLVSSEGSEVVLAEPKNGRIATVGMLDRLDLSDGYDPGGLHRVVIHGLPDSADVLIEFEFGIARVDVSEWTLAWQQVHGDLTNRVKRLSTDHVWLEGENTQFGHRLSDGGFVLQGEHRRDQRD